MPQKPRAEQSQDRTRRKKNGSARTRTTAQDRAALHAAALDLAARHGWVDITVAEIYAQAGQPLPAAAPASVWPLVADILASLDARVATEVASRLGGSWRDDLFEVLMTRFEVMQPQRDAYSDIMPAALTRACHAGRVMTRRLTGMIDAAMDTAGVPSGGLRRHAAVVALTGLYLSLLDVWRQDDTPDMAKTMAALDQRLGWFADILAALSGRKAQADA